MLQAPYLVFLGDATDPLSIKMAKGVATWKPELCVGQYRLPGCSETANLPDMNISEAAEKGAKTFVLGFANSGGKIDQSWLPFIIQAIENGMDIVSGLHDKLTDFDELVIHSEKHNVKLIDIRHPSEKFATGTGYKRTGKRLLTVGTDCSVGKMYTSLALESAMRESGMNVDFRATGQCGVLIAGKGLAIDCVVADFISGAAETLSPDNVVDHWDIIEGQGSLSHPAFAGVSLGLLHGSQPDAIVVCHALGRTTMRGITNRPLPTLKHTIELNLAAASITNPNVKIAGITINTSSVSETEANDICRNLSHELGLPVVDPLRHGVQSIVDNL
ncbi:N-acetyltransferase DgcN [Pseudoalteromonas sp. SSM20]|uniref:N-acetyltransferase DgcN n=1 Tax=Pseudoalteromonas sp. SSM20 TaxID=3139394 RepID=UPI003BAC9E30